jgi:3-oxoacid CoA-transferase subunit A
MVYITGDIHGKLEYLDRLCAKYSPGSDDVVVLLGDVGVNYSGTLDDITLKDIMNSYGTTFFCIHGNHEARPQNIGTYVEKEWHGGRVLYEERFPNILFPVDGDIFDLEGRKCLVIGGAYSVDRFYRQSTGQKWFPDEQPTPAIKEYTEQQIKRAHIDVIFSHTCPFRYIPAEALLDCYDQSKVDNSTERWLGKIEQEVDYKAWYAGHWHIDKHIDRMHFLLHSVEVL